MALAYLFWPLFSRRRISFYLVGMLAIIISAGFPFIYLRLLEYITDTEQFFLLGQSVFSRYRLWNESLDLIIRNPFLGYGTHAGLNLLTNYIWQQGHSAFIELYIRTGLIGGIAYSIFLMSVWGFFWHGREDKICRVCGAFLIGNIIYQIFVTDMIVYTNVAGCLSYLIIGLGISRIINRSSEST